MTSLNHLVGAVSGEILKMSLEASVMILALLLVCWLLRGHLSARLRYSLWLLVWIKLTLPWLPESVTSIYGLWDGKTEMSEPQTSKRPHNPLASTSAVDVPIADFSAELPNVPVYETPNVSSDNNPADVNPIQFAPTMEPSNITLGQMASFAWGLGALGMCMVMVGNMLSLRRRVLSSSTDLQENMKEMFVQSLKTRGLSKKISIRMTEAVESPALYGVFRPVILIPKSVMGKYSNEELRLVLLHELEHQMRRDHWVNVWTSVLLALHWFNPIVWYAVKRMRSDREFAVDEAVLRHSNVDAETYGESILKTMDRLSGQRMQPGLVGILEDKTALKERFERIARFDVHKRESKGEWALVVFILTCTFLSHPIQSDVTEAIDKIEIGIVEENQSEDQNSPKSSRADLIRNRLKEKVIKEAHFKNVPFSTVYRWLYFECGFDGDSMFGAYFLLSGSDDGTFVKESLPLAKQIMASRISIDPPMYDVTAWEICERMVEESSIPIKLRVTDSCVLFCYDSSADQIKYETRTYRVPIAEEMIQKAKEILQVGDDEDWSAFESLGKIFEAAGLTYFNQPNRLSEEEENAIQSSLHPFSKPPFDPRSNDSQSDRRAIFYKPNSGMLLVQGPIRELNLVDRIVEALTHSPPNQQIVLDVTSAFLTRSIPMDNVRHVLLRPLGKEIIEESVSPNFTNQQFLLSPEDATSYLDSIRRIQGVELVKSQSVTTVSLRQATFYVPLEKADDAAPQYFAPGPASMKITLYPAINQKPNSKYEMIVGLYAILPELSRHGQFVMFPDESQFPEMNGGGLIPKGETLLVHYSRNKTKGKPWEDTSEEWLQEFVVLVTPTLIDPAGNRID